VASGKREAPQTLGGASAQGASAGVQARSSQFMAGPSRMVVGADLWSRVPWPFDAHRNGALPLTIGRSARYFSKFSKKLARQSALQSEAI
jgi:hypothetical protein